MNEETNIETPVSPEVNAATPAATQEVTAEANNQAIEVQEATPVAEQNVVTTEQPTADDTCPITGCDTSMCYLSIAGIAIIVILILTCVFRKKSCKCNKGNKGKDDGNFVEIYVGNLNYDMTDQQLYNEFKKFGVVKSARIITQRSSKKSKGYGFVEMPHRSEAVEAIKALNNKEIMGRKLHVNEARANTRPTDRKKR